MSEHECRPPWLSPYKAIWSCGCGDRFICIGSDHRFPDFAEYSIWKPTAATERWPRLLRNFA